MSSKAAAKVPEWVEPFRFADQGLSFAGAIPLSRMSRLSESLQETEDEVAVELEFGRDGQGRPRLWGRVDALFSIQCQRCLETMQMPVNIELDLLLARSEAEAEKIGPGEDALVVSEDLVSLPAVVEDELLLAMPIIARHPEGMCQIEWESGAAPPEATEEQRENPFSVLAGLKKNH